MSKRELAFIVVTLLFLLALVLTMNAPTPIFFAWGALFTLILGAVAVVFSIFQTIWG